MGAPIKGWISLFQFEILVFLSFSKEIKYMHAYQLLVIIIGISHFAVLCLPFIINKNYFKKALLIAPPIFILSFSVISGLIFIVLIPFVLLWLIALKIGNKYDQSLKDEA